jgi:hypothetical protein
MWFTSSSITEDVTSDVKTLPHDERLNGTKLQRLQCVFDTEAVATGVLTDLIEVLLNEFLLLDELDVRQRLGCELNRLVETVLAAIRNIHDLDDLGSETLIEQITLSKFRLEVGTTSENKSSDVDLVVCDEMLNGVLSDLADVVVPLFVTQT